MGRQREQEPTNVVRSFRHSAKRKNIPTEELRDFVRDDEQSPPPMLYERDPSLDPQLVWNGKDQQDNELVLQVPVVPIYIQEKLHPHAVIEDMRRRHERQPVQQQFDLFADFNGLEDFGQRLDFYHHEQNWSNRLILGDSLLALTSLAQKEGLKGQVQMVYFDPPYGIKFGSNWQVSTRKAEVKDRAEDATRQPEQVRAFRDTWELGIHSYLAYIRERLVVCREMLTETGSIFVQIGDENVHLVRCLLDEVFGSEQFIANICFKKKKMPLGETYIFTMCDYLLWYGKDSKVTKFRKLFSDRDTSATGDFNYVQMPSGEIQSIASFNGREKVPADAKAFQSMDMRSSGRTESCVFEVTFDARKFFPSAGKSWKTNPTGMRNLLRADRLFAPGDSLRYKLYLDDYPKQELSHMWLDTQGAMDKEYVVQTSTKVVERCMLMTTDPGDLVLDPTCGSGTTAYVAEQWGRRWITVDTSRVALALARTRLMTARFPYYLLADSPQGIAKEAEVTGKTPPAHGTSGDIKKGFVYGRCRHTTLGAITNNEEIDTIHAKWQDRLEPLREKLNKQLKANWQEWQLFHKPEEDWPDEAKLLLAEWCKLRRKRQNEIDESIARHADQELLYDQPYEDKSIVRVTGPFTVESLSPHRQLSVERKRDMATKPDEHGRTLRLIGPDRFGNMIIDNLKKAGVQNRIKEERLAFDTLEPFAGEWIHAAGQYTTKDGQARRVAVCIGPEHGTVGRELIKEAAKEAVRGVGFDLLLVCGFAFDPHVDEETKRYGKLEVQTVRMNPDLSMGEELLKKTGAGNLFMIFGEPDITITRVGVAGQAAPASRGKKSSARQAEPSGDEQIVVEIHGVDVYDPTTGQIRSNSTDDIACWFIDTNYDGESFFVRHAYFTGADEPYEKLKRALRADIDESAWSALYSTKSQPFPLPETGKIAVKVINHYGDEVLKVYEIH